MKRAFDIIVGATILIVSLPVLIPVAIMVYLKDRHSPLYISERMGRYGRPFRMIKLRSMIVNADRTGVDSTGSHDSRITPIGHFIRQWKLDELTQVWNVIRGDMSMVGPRPNVQRETAFYTAQEKNLLSVRPGLTDFASIVFSDEGSILCDQHDPDLAYNQLIRPGKSALGLFYVSRASLWVDGALCACTALAIVHRPAALKLACALLRALGAPPELVKVASRTEPLVPSPPPGASEIVTSRPHLPAAQSVGD